MVFCLRPIQNRDKGCKKNSCWRLLMEICSVLRLLVYQANTPRVSLQLLRVGFDSFRIFSDYVKIPSAYSETIMCTANNLNLSESPYKLNTFRVFSEYAQILSKHFHSRLNAFHIFSEYAERNLSFQTIPGDVEGTVFQTKLNRGLLAQEEQITYSFKLFMSLKKMLSAYMENTLNGEKSIKSEHILVSDGST